jgi:hypothetical protein
MKKFTQSSSDRKSRFNAQKQRYILSANLNLRPFAKLHYLEFLRKWKKHFVSTQFPLKRCWLPSRKNFAITHKLTSCISQLEKTLRKSVKETIYA